MGKFALDNEGGYMGGQGITGEFVDIRQKLILEMPEMLLGFDSRANSIMDFLDICWFSGVMDP